jgi:hypothetical protein
VEYTITVENGAAAFYMVRVFGVDGRHPAPFSSVAEMGAWLAAFTGTSGPEEHLYITLDENADDLDGPIHSNSSEPDPLGGGIFDALAGHYVNRKAVDKPR